jgi:PAS domain S-box-containing protein
MLRDKILKTALPVTVVVAIAMVSDYVLNILILHEPAAYSPLATFLISAIIAVPLAYSMTSQKIDLQRLRDDLSGSLVAKEAAVDEAQRRRVEAEEALVKLEESDRLYRLLAENLTDNLGLWSANGERLYISPSIEKITGYTVAESLAQRPDTNIDPEQYKRVMKIVRALEPGGPPATAEYQVTRKDGAVVWIESAYSKAGDGSGVLITASRDITERKTLALELTQALEAAQAATAAKSDFLANMTHELRTPLTAIIGFAEVLKGSKSLTRRDARHVGLIRDASGALLGVVNDVLDFSRLEAGALDLDPRPFDPGEIAASCAALVEDQARERGLKLSVSAPKTLKPMEADANRLSQVLLNFLSNALKFTDAGSITISLSQKIEGDDARLRVEVADTGIGIAPHQLTGVFDRFSQADATVSRRFGGTGLGLAISRRIIERMDGGIGVESKLGEGSRFWFEIVAPLCSLKPVAARSEPDRPETEAGVRLLVVEDNAVNRELVRAMLEPFDIDIQTANDGAAGVEAMRQGRYDLVLMDVQMPVMDGLTATRAIRAFDDPEGGRTPIVALTANVLPEQVANCLAAGMDDHLGKPINPVKLLETVVRWSGKQHAAL